MSIQTPKARTTIYDIAGRIGMSHATVSRALRNHPAISRATRDRVQKLADEMNYRPNLVARGLVRGHTGTVGLLINGFFIDAAMEKVLALDKIARSQNHQLFVTNTEGDIARTLEAAWTLMGRGVDGILIYGLSPAADDPALAELLTLPVPMVFFDVPIPAECTQVVLDRSDGIASAVDQLVALGHREICMLCADASRWQVDQRLIGFMNACERHQIPNPRERLYATGVERREGKGRPNVDPAVVRDCVSQLLTKNPGCTAILCNNDFIAIIVLSILADMKRQVPGDISVVGFDDIATSEYLRPSLSTVAQPYVEVADATWQLLRETMEQPTAPPKTVTVLTRFIARGSIGRAPR